MLRSIPVMLVTAAALVLTGCADRGAGASEVTALDAADAVVVAEDAAFVDPPEALPAGTVVLGLDNRGSDRHDLTIEGHGAVAEARGGRLAAGEVTLEPGRYTIWCDVSWHRRAGMEFTVDVR